MNNKPSKAGLPKAAQHKTTPVKAAQPKAVQPKATGPLGHSGGLVYSTDSGRMCPSCRQPMLSCACKANAQAAARPKGDGIVRVSRESKGRGGKAVTLVRGLDLADDALAALGKRLRTACGAGGTVKDGVLEIQGDHCDRVVADLQKEGWTVKRAGG